ncbi:MAG: hypothetical protein ACHP65_10630, partial [Legionellales bacterium]
MAKKTPFKKQQRDALGNVIHPTTFSSIDVNDHIRRWQHTYIFQYFDTERQDHWPYFDLFTDLDKELEIAKKRKDFKEVHLFQFPEKHTDRDIYYHNWLLQLFHTHFSEVFNLQAFRQGYGPDFN